MLGKLCREADLSKDECREISQKLCPKMLSRVVLDRVVPELPRLPSLPTMEEMPTLAEGLKEPKKKH